MPNFRQAGGSSLYNRHGQKVKDDLLFRSSRTDYLTEEESDKFCQFGIKLIVDLRRNAEYVKAEGDKILDRVYKPCILKNGKIKQWINPARAQKKASGKEKESDHRGRRILVNLMTMELIKQVVYQVNIFIRLFSFLLLAIDYFFDSHLFVRLYSYLVSNHTTLADQYLIMLEFAKSEIVDIMRLLVEEKNVPVLIHCAHGKDRTGVIVALILGCLEVEDDVIVKDYSQSEVSLITRTLICICIMSFPGLAGQVELYTNSGLCVNYKVLIIKNL